MIHLLKQILHATLVLRINAFLLGFFIWFVMSQGNWYTISKTIMITDSNDQKNPYAFEVTVKGKRTLLYSWLKEHQEISEDLYLNGDIVRSLHLPLGVKLISYKPLYRA